MAFPPNGELVAIHWLKGVDGVPTDQVGTTVPEASDEFAANGFVQVQFIGGTPHLHTGMERSLIQVDSWAYNARSQKVPWGKAATLLAHVKEGTKWDAARVVTTPSNFDNARVRVVEVAVDPRRVEEDSDIAHYSMDIRIHWTRLAKAAA